MNARLALWIMAVGVMACGPVPALGQGRPGEEGRLLREAAARESRGDYPGAEQVLRQLLERSPGSSGGLFALERVLRAQGRLADVLSSVDSFLARDPTSSGVRYLKLRVLLEVDSLETLEREVEAWFRADPGSATPYREVSRLYARAFGVERALETLRRGRRVVGEPDALALEMGDLLAEVGDVPGAVEEWARAVGRDGARATTVAGRLAGLGADAGDAGRGLLERLSREGGMARRRAAVRIALDLGLEPEALALSRGVAGELSGRDRAAFLNDVGRKARERRLARVAVWAYEELGVYAASNAERRSFDRRVVELSLAAGDTAAALEAQRRVAGSLSVGSVDRRRATARVIGLEGARADPQRLRELLDAFRTEFPDAPELDQLAAEVAAGLRSRGDGQGARAVLEGIEGPRSALERGYLQLEEGDVEGGRGTLLQAVPGLTPSDATEVIQFAGLLARLSPPAAELLARAGVASHYGRAGDAARLAAAGAGALPEHDRSAVLAEVARMSDRGGEAAAAAELRQRIVREFPDAAERWSAALELARYKSASPGGTEEAIRLLEDLLAAQPNAAVAPSARRELQRLRAGGGR